MPAAAATRAAASPIASGKPSNSSQIRTIARAVVGDRRLLLAEGLVKLRAPGHAQAAGQAGEAERGRPEHDSPGHDKR